MPDIALRPATADDAEFFFALHKGSFSVYVDQIWGWDDDVQRAYLGTHFAPNAAASASTNVRTRCTAGSVLPRSHVTASRQKSGSGWWQCRDPQHENSSSVR
jgi:hypothetical protein